MSEIKKPDYSTKNRYLLSDLGPYLVIVEKEDFTDIGLGRFLKNSKIKGIDLIKRYEKNKYKIFCKYYYTANSIADNEMKLENAKFHIPDYALFTKAFVKSIPLEFDLQKLLDDNSNYDSRYPIVDVQRVYKWDKDKKENKPTTNIIITLRCFKLPKFIKLYNDKKKICYFIPRIKHCKKCLKYGHTINQCKNKKICGNCTKEHTNLKCSKKPKCLFCTKNNNHKTNDKKCEFRKKNQKINRLVVMKKFSYSEAVEYLKEKEEETIIF